MGDTGQQKASFPGKRQSEAGFPSEHTPMMAQCVLLGKPTLFMETYATSYATQRKPRS